MIDTNAVYFGLYSIVDELRTHLSESDLIEIKKELTRSKSFNTIMNKCCAYNAFNLKVLKCVASYVDASAAFGYACTVKLPEGGYKYYYSDDLLKILQNVLRVTNPRYAVAEIAKAANYPKSTILSIFSKSHAHNFNAVRPEWWSEFQDRLNIRIYICMRYQSDSVFGSGVQFSPCVNDSIVLRRSTSHDAAVGNDTFYSQSFQFQSAAFKLDINSIDNCKADAIEHLDVSNSSNNTVIEHIESVQHEVKHKDSTDDLLLTINSLNAQQMNKLLQFTLNLYDFNISKAIINEAKRANQLNAVKAFISVLTEGL